MSRFLQRFALLVAGFTGEQFALPEAVGLLREARRRKTAGVLVSVSGADPLNLIGIITPGPRLPAVATNRVLYKDGQPLATLAAGEASFLESLSASEEWEMKKLLIRGSPQAFAENAG